MRIGLLPTDPLSLGAALQRTTQEQLARTIREFLDAGTTALADSVMENPVSDYTDPVKLSAEKSALFRRLPLVVGHRSQCAQPRDFFTTDPAGVPVLVVRQSDGTLAAFLNVCRHRGSKVTFESCGHRNAFVCPYHAWTYRLDGTLAGVTDSEDFGAVDRSDLSLVRLPIEERHGFIWVVLTPGLPIDVAAHLGPILDAELAAYGFDGFTVDRSHTTPAELNWKLVIDGFLETYHLGHLHRTTIGPHIRSNLAPFRSFGPHGCMTAVRTSFERVRHVTDEDAVDYTPHLVHAYNIFPNTVMVWSGAHLEAWLVFPEGDEAGRSNVTVHVLGRADHVASETDYWDKNWTVVTDTVLTEDFTVGSSIQQGCMAGAQRSVMFGRNEPGVQHFHRSVNAAL